MAKTSEKRLNDKEIFDLKRKTLELSFDLDTQRHLMKMKELAFIRETDKIRHEQENERQRIKSAEIRKAQERLNDKKDFQRYSR
jgi:hypothetical protein